MAFSPLRHISRIRGTRRGRPAVYVGALILSAASIFTGCSSGNGTSQGPRQAPGVSVGAAPAVAKEMPLQIRAIGNVQAYSTVQVRAQVYGPIVGAYFKEGQDVRKGDPLFKIDPRPYEIALKQAESAGARDRAQLKNAEEEVGRNTDLAGKDFVTKERYDQLQSNAEVLRASVKADDAKLQLAYCSISSRSTGERAACSSIPAIWSRPRMWGRSWSSIRSARSTSPSPSRSRTCP